MATTNGLVATKRDLEPREARVISDALYDMRATSTRAQHLAIVREAAVALLWSQAEVLAAVNALATAPACYACDGRAVGVRGVAPEGCRVLPACARHAEPGLGFSLPAVAA